MKTCMCGSDKPRYELRDAAGIFCTFVCEDCEKKKTATFNPRIFEESYDADQPDVHFANDY